MINTRAPDGANKSLWPKGWNTRDGGEIGLILDGGAGAIHQSFA